MENETETNFRFFFFFFVARDVKIYFLEYVAVSWSFCNLTSKLLWQINSSHVVRNNLAVTFEPIYICQ